MEIVYEKTKRLAKAEKTRWGTTTDRIIKVTVDGTQYGTLEHLEGSEWQFVRHLGISAVDIFGPFHSLQAAKKHVKMITDQQVIDTTEEEVEFPVPDTAPELPAVNYDPPKPKKQKTQKKWSCTCRPDVEKALKISGESFEDFQVVRRNATNVEVWKDDKFTGLYGCWCKCGNEGVLEYLMAHYEAVDRQVGRNAHKYRK